MYEDAAPLAKQVRLAIMRERHNTLADVEKFCTGTVSKLKRYAPLLRHIAGIKEHIRLEMQVVDQPFGDNRG